MILAAEMPTVYFKQFRDEDFFPPHSFYLHSMNFPYILLFKIALADGVVQLFEHESGTKELEFVASLTRSFCLLSPFWFAFTANSLAKTLFLLNNLC